jgi:hypothetical protein
MISCQFEELNTRSKKEDVMWCSLGFSCDLKPVYRYFNLLLKCILLSVEISVLIVQKAKNMYYCSPLLQEETRLTSRLGFSKLHHLLHSSSENKSSFSEEARNRKQSYIYCITIPHLSLALMQRRSHLMWDFVTSLTFLLIRHSWVSFKYDIPEELVYLSLLVFVSFVN